MFLVMPAPTDGGHEIQSDRSGGRLGMGRNDIDAAAQLVVDGLDLPGYVFARRFLSHFFFDSNLGYPELTDAIRELVTPCLGPDTRIAVFSAYTRAFLGWLEASDDWSSTVDGIAQRMWDQGDHGGMFWVDVAGRLAVYQRQPVDLGVVALDADIPDHVVLNATGDTYFATDHFFGPAALELLLQDKSERGLSRCESKGRQFMQALVRNYA